MRRQVGDAALAPLVQYRFAFDSRADLHATRIPRVGCNIDKVVAGESGDDAAHGRGFDLLGGGQFAERFWTTENQHRERRKPGGAFTGGNVLLAHAAKQVDRC